MPVEVLTHDQSNRTVVFRHHDSGEGGVNFKETFYVFYGRSMIDTKSFFRNIADGIGLPEHFEAVIVQGPIDFKKNVISRNFLCPHRFADEEPLAEMNIHFHQG